MHFSTPFNQIYTTSPHKPSEALERSEEEIRRRSERQAPEGALGTNTNLRSPCDDPNVLEATWYKAFSDLDRRSRLYVLQNVSKQILNTNEDALYIPITTAGNCRVERSSTLDRYVFCDSDQATHLQVTDSAGFSRYITLKAVRSGRYLYDQDSGRYRRAIYEHEATHHKVSPKFYRCGACGQLSTAFRPERIWGDFSKQDYAYISEQVSVANISVEKTCDDNLYRSKLMGLVKCKSPHSCPDCQAFVSDLKQKQVDACLYQHCKNGGYAAMVTFTVAHKKCFSLQKTLDGLRHAYRRVTSGKAWQNFKEKFGFIGHIDSLEYTYTETNGHHPHKHCIFLFDKKVDPREIKKILFERYKKFFEKMEGFKAPSFERGIDVSISATQDQINEYFSTQHKDGDQLPSFVLSEFNSLSKYITKGIDVEASLSENINSSGWTVGTEITHSHCKRAIYPIKTKSGFKTGYTATGLLIAYYACSKILNSKNISDENRSYFYKKLLKFKNLYCEYSAQFQGKPQVAFSKGLKKLYEVDEKIQAIIDAQLDSVDSIQKVKSLSIDDLALIAKRRLRSRVESIAEQCFNFTKDCDKTREAIDNFLLLHVDQQGFSGFGDDT